jgi:hypothetical protein
MVKIAFICEDDAGKKIVDSEDFEQILQQNDVELLHPVYNVKGKGNLTEENVRGLVGTASDAGAKCVFLLTDMDLDACTTVTRQKLIQDPLCKIIVCKKAIESWFLADTDAISAVLKQNGYFEYPEEPPIPFDTINQLHKDVFNGRGISKAILPIKMIGNGFSLVKAANHPNCSSALYFLQKIQAL